MSTLKIHTTGKAKFLILLEWPSDELGPTWPISFNRYSEELLLVSDMSFGSDENYFVQFYAHHLVVGDGTLDISDEEIIFSHLPDIRKIAPDILKDIIAERLPNKKFKIKN